MVSITLPAEITEDGQLKIQMPPHLRPGKVEVEIRSVEFEGVSLGEILDAGIIGLWADRDDIQDSIKLAEELRRRASRRGEA
ncbi:MAG: hypothetical protein SF029_23645 [bacterium]|nr:hypothetical protein [bacterium]